MSDHRLADVARLAGVSVATVSRVISRPGSVNVTTRARVLKVLASTGYRLNVAARNLRLKRTGCIAALVPDLGNSYFSTILTGISEVVSREGYNLVVADTRVCRNSHISAYFDPSKIDALLLLDGSLPASLAASRPVVTVSEWIPDLEAPRALIDNASAARMAVEHLAGLGHRQIGHVTGPRENIVAQTRLRGAVAATQALGLPPLLLIDGDFSASSGKKATQVWLDAQDRPTGMFFASDEMACGFIWEAQRSGIKIPQDVSIVGFDDIASAEHLFPSLTTVRQPRAALGRESAECLLRLLRGDAGMEDIVLGTDLICRASSAARKTTGYVAE